jgi:hypothetical protein
MGNQVPVVAAGNASVSGYGCTPPPPDRPAVATTTAAAHSHLPAPTRTKTPHRDPAPVPLAPAPFATSLATAHPSLRCVNADLCSTQSTSSAWTPRSACGTCSLRAPSGSGSGKMSNVQGVEEILMWEAGDPAAVGRRDGLGGAGNRGVAGAHAQHWCAGKCRCGCGCGCGRRRLRRWRAI